MQLRAHENGDLELTAATCSTSEFGALHDVLGKTGLFRIRNPLRRDRMKRMVQEYHISRRQIKQLENILGGSFDKQRQFISKRTQGRRKPACREVTTGAPGGCEDIKKERLWV